MLPSGVWSTLITLLMCSSPSIASWAPGVNCARCKARAAAFQRMSSTSELLPEPETPVTAVTTPRGMRTSRFLRLCCRAPLITIAGTSGVRRGRPPVGRHRNRRLAAQVRAGQRLRRCS